MTAAKPIPFPRMPRQEIITRLSELAQTFRASPDQPAPDARWRERAALLQRAADHLAESMRREQETADGARCNETGLWIARKTLEGVGRTEAAAWQSLTDALWQASRRPPVVPEPSPLPDYVEPAPGAFPIIDGPHVPWSLLEGRDDACRRMFGADVSLERKAWDGGLTVAEVLALLDGDGDYFGYWARAGRDERDRDANIAALETLVDDRTRARRRTRSAI